MKFKYGCYGEMQGLVSEHKTLKAAEAAARSMTARVKKWGGKEKFFAKKK